MGWGGERCGGMGWGGVELKCGVVGRGGAGWGGMGWEERTGWGSDHHDYFAVRPETRHDGNDESEWVGVRVPHVTNRVDQPKMEQRAQLYRFSSHMQPHVYPRSWEPVRVTAKASVSPGTLHTLYTLAVVHPHPCEPLSATHTLHTSCRPPAPMRTTFCYTHSTH